MFVELALSLAPGLWLALRVSAIARAGPAPRRPSPHALEQKYPKVGHTWAWFWMFPSPTLSIDPRSGVERRHHLFEERLQRALKKAVALAGICHSLAAGGLLGKMHQHYQDIAFHQGLDVDEMLIQRMAARTRLFNTGVNYQGEPPEPEESEGAKAYRKAARGE